MNGPSSYLKNVKCLECDQDLAYFPGLDRCPACDGAWLDAHYEYQAVANIWSQGLRGREPSLWRYWELLPVLNPRNAVTMGEGQSPLIRAAKIEKQLGHPNIFIKDERQSPTSSFKDRQAAVAITVMREAGTKECVLASTGNAAAAYAAYCARADIKLWIFLTSLVPAAKMREAALYGAEVIKVTGTYDQAKRVAADFAARRRIQLDKGAKAIPGKESMKTVAFEIAEALAHQMGNPAKDGAWKAPDWYIQAVSGGIGPLGVQKGFQELYRMGLIDRVPKIGIIQVAGCAPMVRAFAKDKPQADPVIPETRITVLSTGEPGLSYELLYKAIQLYGGYMLEVTDEQAFAAMHFLAKTEGYSVEPAAAVAFAGLDKLVEKDIIKPDETVVVNCSGHTFPVEKHIIDEDNVLVDVKLSYSTQAVYGAPVDGLGSALKQLDEQITTIVVIDDNPMDSRLIRRLLQTKKPYRVFEANRAIEGLEIIRERVPDLVVSDLAMPEMDGFALLEELKRDPITAGIPIIVVSAKELTPEDKRRLAGQTSSIWLKGSFAAQDLVEHVVDALSTSESGIDPASLVSEREEPEEVVPQLLPPLAKSTPNLLEKKIVLVEDNPMDARLISRILQMLQPLKIKQVRAGVDAIRVIREEEPDLVVLDLIVPGKDGFQILKELKQEEKLDLIPVIVITSKDLSETERQLLRSSGVSSMWQKDKLDREQLLAHVDAQLN